MSGLLDALKQEARPAWPGHLYDPIDIVEIYDPTFINMYYDPNIILTFYDPDNIFPIKG